MGKKTYFDETTIQQIKDHLLQSKSAEKTSKAFYTSKYHVLKITGWTRKDYDQSLLDTYGTKEERKARKLAYDKAYLQNPEAKAIKNARQNKAKAKQCIRRMTWNANVAAKKNNRCQHKLTHMDVWSVAKKQKLICPITKIKLTPKTISLDHIVPLARGGTNTKDNIQLIDYNVNIMKRHFLMCEFYVIIEKIWAARNIPAAQT